MNDARSSAEKNKPLMYVRSITCGLWVVYPRCFR